MTINNAYSMFQANRLTEAKRIAARLVRSGEHVAEAHQLLGYIEGKLGNLEAASRHLEMAVKLAPAAVEAWYYLGMARRKLERHEAAVSALQRALALAPDFFEATHDLALSLHALGRFAEAAQAYDRATDLQPTVAEAHVNRGINLSQLHRYVEEVACYERALQIHPQHGIALENLGQALCQLGEFSRAIDVFQRLLALVPDHAVAQWSLLQAKLKICDWSDHAAHVERARRAINDESACVEPLALARLPSTPEEQLRVARRFSRQFELPGISLHSPRAVAPSRRLRLGYLSSDFGAHAVAKLAARLFELHDRSRLESFAFSTRPDDGSPMRQRLHAAFDHFVDIEGHDEAAAAAAIAHAGIDILIDLNGHTEHSRPRVLALRPAPLQVAYLGYPGTSGAPFIDYVVADDHVVPPHERVQLSEKLIVMPYSYMAPDAQYELNVKTPSRAEAGLPEEGFVYACFNDVNKITPEVFAVWMRTLSRTAGSVLWLQGRRAETCDNLRAAAIRNGVSPQRLVFAPRLADSRDHLARLRLADLFLDTLPYNAHATACDALGVGLPLLTCTGNTWAGRVATSLLYASGLPELVTADLASYEALAVALAQDEARYRQLRQRLTQSMRSAMLFDTERFARSFEDGLVQVWARHRAGQTPDHVTAAP